MKTIKVENIIDKNVKEVWEFWTNPEHIVNWNFASPEWHCPKAEHELKVGGMLKYHMAARDGSLAFDYVATFSIVKPNELLEYTLGDGRKVSIEFIENGNTTQIIESFEIEDESSIDIQRQGWQAILDNFKKYVEAN